MWLSKTKQNRNPTKKQEHSGRKEKAPKTRREEDRKKEKAKGGGERTNETGEKYLQHVAKS